MIQWLFISIFYLILPENIQGKVHSTILFFLGLPYLFYNFADYNIISNTCNNYEYSLLMHSFIYYLCNTIRISTIEYNTKMNIFIFHHFFTIIAIGFPLFLNCKLLDFLFLVWASVGGFFYHLSMLKPHSIICRTSFISFYLFSRLIMLYICYIFLTTEYVIFAKITSFIIVVENYYFLYVMTKSYIKLIKPNKKIDI
jgi:hypothetical protein